MVSPSEVSKYIGELGIVKMALKEADIEHILDTIVADGKAERSESMEGSVLYRAVVPYLESAGFSRWVTWTKASCLLQNYLSFHSFITGRHVECVQSFQDVVTRAV